MTHRSALCLSVLIAMPTLSACGKNKRDSDNPDVAAAYADNKYEEDIVTARRRKDYEDQGTAIDPKTLAAIEDTIKTVYLRDLERCLEDEMGEEGTRFIRSVFTVQFDIDTEGQASGAKILDIWEKKQNAKGGDIGEVDPSRLKGCIEGVIAEWVFEPAPEAPYSHTYRGQVGEAF
ncbi:hypothetical protein [Paraliomyxa miuraensis]|uniref:hypothetical protein n=1 Tax=Paraliomyxa miuraensis TaxID=376150 RepID=UPI0022508E5F|nr:hypothetical protein [Paraliomyxa miuraensis]MCX4244676.1 hypothetical protein [Paraliomyxa miuraensis]